MAEGLAAASPGTVLHSGTDYTPQSLAGALSPGKAKDAANAPPMQAAPGAQNVPRDEGGLTRLNDPQALRGCLAAIVARHGGTPSVVDYARFQGQPALIVILATGDRHRIVVAGPTCGMNGPAELYTTMQ
jgi:hypothetical protein